MSRIIARHTVANLDTIFLAENNTLAGMIHPARGTIIMLGGKFTLKADKFAVNMKGSTCGDTYAQIAAARKRRFELD